MFFDWYFVCTLQSANLVVSSDLYKLYSFVCEGYQLLFAKEICESSHVSIYRSSTSKYKLSDMCTNKE